MGFTLAGEEDVDDCDPTLGQPNALRAERGDLRNKARELRERFTNVQAEATSDGEES